MQAKIITIGDEILVGQTVDTNSTYIAKSLNSIGIKVSEILSITDTKPHIIEALENAIGQNQFVILTGGLGPTNDDITKQTLTEYFNDELIEYPEVTAKVKALFERFNKPFLPVNQQQAMLPKTARIIENDLGTASGMWFKKGQSNILSLPGVPYEMKGLFDKFIELVKGEFELGNFYHRSVMIAGIGESFFAEKIKNWEAKNRAQDISVAYLPSVGLLKLRLTGTRDQKAIIDQNLVELKQSQSVYVLGDEFDTLEGKVGQLLQEKKASLGTVESCTGGGLANKIVAMPGASAYYAGSIVSYTNELKMKIVGVSKNTLKQFGAVSEATVIEMATHGQKKLDVDYCVSISGVAGPSGGTVDKPVGLVWIAIATPNGVQAQSFKFGLDRQKNIKGTINAALNYLRLALLSA